MDRRQRVAHATRATPSADPCNRMPLSSLPSERPDRDVAGADVFTAHLRRRSLRRAWRNQARADGIERRLGAALDSQLREDAAHMGLYRLLADAQAAGDLLVGLPLSQQLQHLGLALGERLGALRSADRLYQARGGFRRELDLPRGGGFDRLA